VIAIWETEGINIELGQTITSLPSVYVLDKEVHLALSDLTLCWRRRRLTLVACLLACLAVTGSPAEGQNDLGVLVQRALCAPCGHPSAVSVRARSVRVREGVWLA
jgi:hypothetical protein